MKYFIASDIHGSAKYCRLALEKFHAEEADVLVLLGDLLYHGPRNALPEEYNPVAVIDMLNAEKDHIICVRGNCEAEVDQMVLNFPCLADYAVLAVENTLVYLTHGHQGNEENPLPMRKGDYLLCGHTHVPGIHRHEDFTYMNPGSVSIPKNESCHSYMVLEGRNLFWKNVETGEVYLTDML